MVIFRAKFVYFALLSIFLELLKMISAPLSIDYISVTPAASGARLEMTARCGFAICSEGNFTIRILNDYHKFSKGCILACMPFVDITLTSIDAPGEVIFGHIDIKNIPQIINRWINTDNISAIQNSPLVKTDFMALSRLLFMVEDYRNACKTNASQGNIALCQRIEQDLINYRSRLIVGEILKIYFSSFSMEPYVHSRRDYIFQRFMLALCTDFRRHRDVRYYAGKAGVSLKYFSTVVRQVSGMPPSDWIETVVIAEAKTLLRDPACSIKDIVAALNFPDAPTFTKYFARATSLSPRAYRRTITPVPPEKTIREYRAFFN